MRKTSNCLGLLNPGEDIVMVGGRVSRPWVPKKQKITAIIPKNYLLD